MREDSVMRRQQQGISVTNLDSVKPSKPIIPDKYNNRMNLKKLKRMKYFNKALLELRAWSFSEAGVSSCANIKVSVEKMIMQNKALTTYREVDDVYIELKTGHPDMLGKYEISNLEYRQV